MTDSLNSSHDKTALALQTDVENTETKHAWTKLVGGTILIIALVTATVFIVFSQQLWYELVLVTALTSYFPLTYLSYRHFRGKVHRARVQDDFKLLGIATDDGRLDQAYKQVYSSQQFAVYVALAVLATLLGFGIFRVPGVLGQSFIDDIDSVLRVMFYTFLGAYAFSAFYVYRRYVTLDLQPSVYLYITVRMFTVQAIAFVIAHQLPITAGTTSLVPIVAFVIGYIPDTGLRWMTTIANRILEWTGRREGEQLSAIEGISLWHETRLQESGIDKIQNLAAANVPDLLMASRFSAQELMHWIDQAVLHINVSTEQLKDLHKHGIHTISALHLLMDKADELETVQLPDFDKLSIKDLGAIYYATTTGPNLHYLTHYWQAVETYRTEMVNRSLADALKDQFQSADLAGTDLTDVPAERLGQVLDIFGLTPEKAEMLFKDSSDSMLGLGRVYIQRKQPKEAERVLNQIITRKPHHAEAFSILGWAKVTQKRYEDALQDFDKALTFFDEAIERDPQKATPLNCQKAIALNRKGTTLLYQRRFDEALTAYDEAINLNNQYASAYYNRGHVKRRLGRFKEAIDNFNQAIEYAPNRANAYLERGMIFLGMGDIHEAFNNFNQAIRRDRSNPDAYFQRSNAHMQCQNHRQALYDLDTALDIDPNNAVLYWQRARVRRKLEDYDGAVADCTQALRLNIDLASAYETRAMIYARQGKLTEAVADFEHCLNHDQNKKERIKKHIDALNKAIQKRERETNGRRSAVKTKETPQKV